MIELLTIMDTLAGSIITGLCICRANNMGKDTSLAIRLTHVALACGGFALVLQPFFRSYDPVWYQTVSHLGLAVFLIADRRKCCRPVSPGHLHPR